MKKLFLIVPAFILIMGFVYSRIMDDKMKHLLQVIQLSEDNAKNIIFSDCSGSYFSLPGLKGLKSIAVGDRASFVESVGNYVKENTTSKDFIKRYNEFRETKKPSPPEKPKSTAEQKKEQKESIQKAIENLEKTKKQMPADQQSSFDETIKSFKEQLKEIDNPDNPMFNADMEKMMKQMYDKQTADYNQKLDDWNKEYPENNPKPMIKKWLRNFLDKTNDVDYNAQTADDQYGRKVFVNSKYESKDYLWKLCYRAGKKPVEAARKFAQAWFGELK